MKQISIKYYFTLHQQRRQYFDLKIDAQSLDLIKDTSQKFPSWAELDFHQCPHCPLCIRTHPYCPVATSLCDIVKRFDNVSSYDPVDLLVITGQRRIFQRTTMQKAIGSLLGILFPTSGCPHTAFFKPMVRFHLPLSSEEDTIFRAIGMYLLGQYFLSKEKGKGELGLNGLKKIYENIHKVNVNISERLRHATKKDSSLNAIMVLDVFTHTLGFVIEDQLQEIEYLFNPYLSEFYQRIIQDAE